MCKACAQLALLASRPESLQDQHLIGEFILILSSNTIDMKPLCNATMLCTKTVVFYQTGDRNKSS